MVDRDACEGSHVNMSLSPLDLQFFEHNASSFFSPLRASYESTGDSNSQWTQDS